MGSRWPDSVSGNNALVFDQYALDLARHETVQLLLAHVPGANLAYAVGQRDRWRFRPHHPVALEQYQEDHAIGDERDERGVCGLNTWAALAAQFGDLEGLRAEESVQEYVDQTYGAAPSSMDPDEQLGTLAGAANEQLASTGIPYVPIDFGDADPRLFPPAPTPHVKPTQVPGGTTKRAVKEYVSGGPRTGRAVLFRDASSAS